jgi:hypothetical protein
MQLLSPIVTLLVSCALAFIAWQQWQVARNKLRLDLFDRRYRVYDATRKFLTWIVSHSTFTELQNYSCLNSMLALPMRSFFLGRK